MSELESIIRQEIAQTGPMPFARFMNFALYCPELGYYEQAKAGIGRRGDYYTSVSTGSLFGELLAHQCAEWAAELCRSAWHLVEAGAHDVVFRYRPWSVLLGAALTLSGALAAALASRSRT